MNQVTLDTIRVHLKPCLESFNTCPLICSIKQRSQLIIPSNNNLGLLQAFLSTLEVCIFSAVIVFFLPFILFAFQVFGRCRDAVHKAAFGLSLE